MLTYEEIEAAILNSDYPEFETIRDYKDIFADEYAMAFIIRILVNDGHDLDDINLQTVMEVIEKIRQS